MSEWTRGELEKIAAAEELERASVRGDRTMRKPVTIWVVRAGDDVHVRSWRGSSSAWFRGVQNRHEAMRARAESKETFVSSKPMTQ